MPQRLTAMLSVWLSDIDTQVSMDDGKITPGEE